MDNPFNDLQDDRSAKETLENKKKLAKEQYNEIVIRVLEQLRIAAYPQLSIRDWSIGKSGRSYIEGTADFLGRLQYYSIWDSTIEVELIFDELGEALKFQCWRRYSSKRIECGLSESELVSALKSLHPPGWNN